MIEKLKFMAVAITATALIIFCVWFIPRFLQETLHGTFNCKYVGDVTVCVSVK